MTDENETVQNAEVPGDPAWQRWYHIQAEFVDDPKRAVGDARTAVGELVEEMMRRVDTERRELDARWQIQDRASTEDLRKALQAYREFFGRLVKH
ncbi:MAG TPA: hypothetical protein VG963_27010 [Polyangiaceae bacterium]|nr:hypothetical protein [Polyangiaceae bacterium]